MDFFEFLFILFIILWVAEFMWHISHSFSYYREDNICPWPGWRYHITPITEHQIISDSLSKKDRVSMYNTVTDRQ